MHRNSLVVIGLALLAVSTPAQTKRPIAGTETTTPPTIDGKLTDPAWATAPVATGFLDVVSGSPATEETTVRLVYDAKNIYLAFECTDSHPESIVARDTLRDSKFQKSGPSDTEDNVQVEFDPFLTHSGADISRFSVNAIGTPSAQFAGGRGRKAEWTGDWEAAAQKTPTGWTAEMRIPWASLNYPTSAQPITMGINFYRYIERTKRLTEWSHVGDRGLLRENEGLWTGVKTPGETFKPKVSYLPYVLGAVGEDKPTGKVGMDLRYTVTPQLTAVGTINPDFSGLEAALQTIAFQHTENFLPEYRPFFLEGRDAFLAPWSANTFVTLFYSRRIEDFDLGAKLYGRLSPKDNIGFLNAYSFDGRNDSVLRLNHDYGETSSAGLTVVRRDSEELTNTLVGVNNHFRKGKFAFDVLALNSMGGEGSGGGLQQASAFYQGKIISTALHVSSISNNFLAPDSFIPIQGYRGVWYSNFINHSWKSGYFSNSNMIIDFQRFDHYNGDPFDYENKFTWELETRNDWLFGMYVNDITFDGSKDKTFAIDLVKGIRNRFHSYDLYLMTGKTGDEKTTLIAPTVRQRLFGKLDVLYTGLIQNRLGVQQQHIATLNYELSPTRSFGGRMVWQDAGNNGYLFYRNSGGKGIEYYFTLGDPNAVKTVKKLQLKVVFAF